MNMNDINESQESIITLCNAYKTYDGSKYILKGLNMNVKAAQIYCLLGASGCGKSTLLNLIVGLLDLDSGSIETTIKERKDVGYMTQETSLYEQLNIRETFYYYGTIHGFSKNEIQIKMNLYNNLLHLPSEEMEVQILSGGQKRRISLAVALLHNPELLILDEPTIGVDSVLRDNIWNYLTELCKEGKKTIIITTHYIEEGKQAHIVGFMRHGKLLCQDTPTNLIESHGTNNLEDVFLHLCQQQCLEETKENIRHYSPTKTAPYPLRLMASNSTLNAHKILGEIKKNVIYLKRNLVVTFTTLLVPVFCMGLFSFTIGGDPIGLKLGIVNDEIPKDINFCNSTRVKNLGCSTQYYSCIYIDKLRSGTLDLKIYNEVSTALEDIKTNKIWGVIHFPQNYSLAVYTLIDDVLTNNSMIFENRAQLYMDYSYLVIKDILLREIKTSYVDMLHEIFTKCNWPIKATTLPIQFETPVYGDAVPNFRIYFALPIMTMLLFFTPCMYGLTIMLEEKRVGATARSIIAGVNIFEVFIAHLIVQLCLQIVQTIAVLGTNYYILGFPFNQPLLAICFLLLHSVAGITLAFSLATFTESLSVSVGIEYGLTMILVMIGGFMWPIEAVPWAIRFLSWIIPSSLPTETLRSLTLKDKGITNFIVLRGFLSNLLWIIVLTSFIIVYLKITRAKTFLKT